MIYFVLSKHFVMQDSLTAEDFAFSEGLPGNKNNYTTAHMSNKTASTPELTLIGPGGGVDSTPPCGF